MSKDGESPSEVYIADLMFSFKDGNVTFLVEDTLFTVHRHFFERDSTIFKNLFKQIDEEMDVDVEATGDEEDEDEDEADTHTSSSEDSDSILSAGEDDLPSGMGTLEDPIVLSDLEVVEFRDFLCVLYPPRFGRVIFKNANRWKNVLTVADHYEFQDIRAYAISKIQAKSPCGTFKLRVGREFGVRSLVVAAYDCLINRANPLTAEDMEGLALNDIANIISMRETQRFTVGMKPVSQAAILTRFKELNDLQ